VKRVYVIGTVLLALSGCASQGMPPEIAAKQNQYNQCMEDLAAKPEFGSIRAKMLLSVKDTPFEAFTNKDLPTPQEKKAISGWAQAITTCWHFEDDFFDYAASRDPSYRVASQTLRSSHQDELLALYQGQTSYGEYLMKSKKSHEEFQRQMAAVNKANLEKTQEIELRRQAIDAMRPPAPIFVPQVMPTPIVPRAPITTNCHRFGNNVNCTTF
jgi:hypothetical protein